MECGVRIFGGLSRWLSLSKGARAFDHYQRSHWSASVHSIIVRTTTPRTAPSSSPPSLCLTPVAQARRLLSTERGVEEATASRQTSSHNPSSSRTRAGLYESFPSDDRPLTNQSWRHFVTSDEKTLVCVHPVKPVDFKDTQPLRPLKPWVGQQRTSLTEDEIETVQKLRNEDGSLWTVNTLARFFNVKRAVIKKVAPANLERQEQLNEEKELMSKLKPYKRKLLRTKRQMERQKRLEAVIAQNKDLLNLREKYRTKS